MESDAGVTRTAGRGMRRGVWCLWAILAVQVISVSCGNDARSFVPNVDSTLATPTMATDDVDTYISDSGYTRYHIVSPSWLIFDDTEDPFWFFPQGLQMEQFDLHMKPQADIVCDSATYYSRRRIWRLDGNVVMVNTDRDSFLTQQLFWDQVSRKVYTDSFIHIVRSDRIIEGYGMISNENMSAYTVNRTTGIIPLDREDRQAAEAVDTAATDTLPPPEAPRRRGAPTRASERKPDSLRPLKLLKF